MPGLHTIGTASSRTGLTPHRIRAWETRHRAITPKRSPTNRRLYSDEDLERLLLLRKATVGPRGISRVAHLSTPDLRQLVRDDERAVSRQPSPTQRPTSARTSADDFLKDCLEALIALDPLGLREILEHATVHLSRVAVMENVIAPLMHALGNGWRDGTLRVVHEHIATAVVRTYLGEPEHAFQLSDNAPEVVVATPLGQLHELGAFMAAAMAISEGWRATYVGPNVHAETIAETARARRARAVALSILHPMDDPRVPEQIEELAQLLPPFVTLIVGGRGTIAYCDALERVGAVRLTSYESLRHTLETLRTHDPAGISAAEDFEFERRRSQRC